MDNITQEMKYRPSIMKYAEKYGVSKTSRKYNRARSYIYFWKKRYNGTIESLACRSRRPHRHPKQHTEEEIKLLQDMYKRNQNMARIEMWSRAKKRGYKRSLGCMYRVLYKLNIVKKPIKNKYIPKPYEQMSYQGQRVQIDVKIVPKKCKVGEALLERLVQYTAIDEYSRKRFLKAYKEQSTYSSEDFLISLVKEWSKKGIEIQSIQTDNGFEFTNRLNSSGTKKLTSFELVAQKLGIDHRKIRPYTPRHNGKVERSHREDQRRFYDCHTFYSFEDYSKQLAAWNSRSNNIPMRPFNFLSPNEFLYSHSVQYV